MPSYPQIQSLKIRNFKGIARLDLPLNETLTLLAGVNGVGKTLAIEALLGAVTRVLNWLSPDGQQNVFDPPGDPVRRGAPEGQIMLELGFEDGVEAACNIPVRTRKLGSVDFDRSRGVILEHGHENYPIPLVVFYDQNRIGGLSSGGTGTQSISNREAALNTTPHALSEFKDWFFEKEGDEAREALERNDLGYGDPELRAVREVLVKIAGPSTKLRSRKPDGSMNRALFLKKEEGFEIPFEALSGGEQAFFLLAVELARRLLLEFPGKSLAEAPGFVCIDEIELHLHPAWQRTILTSLIELFPCCQFVVSTHSPQVIGSVPAEHVRLLSPDSGNGQIKAVESMATKGRDSNYVLEGILDTPEQDPEVDSLFDKFDQLVDAGDFEDADRTLDELDGLVEGNSARVAVRRAKCRRLRQTTE